MMDTMTTLKKWQDEYFTLVKRVEAPVVRFTGERAETVARYMPERPAFMASMPKVSELMDNQLKFSKRMMDEQLAFVRKMMKAMDPMLTKVDTVAKPEKPMMKPMATKMAPRRAAHAAA